MSPSYERIGGGGVEGQGLQVSYHFDEYILFVIMCKYFSFFGFVLFCFGIIVSNEACNSFVALAFGIALYVLLEICSLGLSWK